MGIFLSTLPVWISQGRYFVEVVEACTGGHPSYNTRDIFVHWSAKECTLGSGRRGCFTNSTPFRKVDLHLYTSSPQVCVSVTLLMRVKCLHHPCSLSHSCLGDVSCVFRGVMFRPPICGGWEVGRHRWVNYF